MYFDCPKCSRKETMSEFKKLKHCYRCDECGYVAHKEYLLGWWDATQSITEKNKEYLLYKPVEGSSCYGCGISDDVCDLDNITRERVFHKLSDQKFYAFIHDRAECGVMCEVAPESEADTIARLLARAREK